MAMSATEAAPPAPTTFVPCVEDRAASRGCRHQESARNTLFKVMCMAARALTLPCTDTPPGTCASTTPTGASSHRNALLADAHALLWARRGAVPEGLRREWLDVALTVLSRSAPPRTAQGWCWWLTPEDGSLAGTHCEGDGPGDDAKADEEHEDEFESRARSRKARAPRWKSWTLWDDPRRHQTFLTLRTHATKYISEAGVHMKLEAMIPEAVLRLDGPAFWWRVALFVHCADLSLSQNHPGTPHILPSHVHEKELYDHVLRFLLPPSAGPTATSQRQGRVVSAALRYRMLVEMCCLRLTHTPRCIATWKHLWDSLEYMLCLASAEVTRGSGTADALETHRTATTLVKAMCLYISDYLIPYLTLRDRHIESTRSTFHTANVAFFHAPDAHNGMWESLSVSEPVQAMRTTEGAPSSVSCETATRVHRSSSCASSPPGHVECCVTLATFVRGHESPVLKTDLVSWSSMCADAVEHVTMGPAACDGVRTVADLETLVCDGTKASGENDEDLCGAVLHFLQFTGSAESGTVSEATEEEALLFVSAAARRSALEKFIHRFFCCCTADAFERGGVSRDVVA